MPAIVERDAYLAFGSGVQQAFHDRIFANDVRWRIRGEPFDDAGPRLAAIVRSEYKRR